MIWNVQGRNITQYNDITGTEHYIMMWMWNVQGRNITKQYGIYKDRTLHNDVDVECTGT